MLAARQINNNNNNNEKITENKGQCANLSVIFFRQGTRTPCCESEISAHKAPMHNLLFVAKIAF